MTIDDLKQLFAHPELLDQALTHRSWVNEHPSLRGTNERLEFLGDAILEYIVSEALYHRFPNKEEGFLTSLRSNLVNTANLARIAAKLALGENLFLSKGEEETGGRQNPSLLADTFEAVIGALYLDRGIATTTALVEKCLLADIKKVIKKPLKDAKSRLQELIQAKSQPAPRYSVVGQTGPDHHKHFVVEVTINSHTLASGSGKSKAEAEQQAAEQALKKY